MDGLDAARPTAPDAASEAGPAAPAGLHWAWVVAAVTFVTLVGSAAFRSVPGGSTSASRNGSPIRIVA